MATQEIPVTPHALPAGYCFTTLQDLLDTFSAHQTVELPEGSTGLVVSESTPIADDQDKVWLKLDGSGNPVNFYWFNGGSWVEVNPPNVFWGLASNVGNAYSVAVAKPPPALVTGQLYLFKITAANTGAATLQVNAFGVFPFNAAGLALNSGELTVNAYVGAVWTGTTFELLGGIPTLNVSRLVPGPESSRLVVSGGVAQWLGRITLTSLTLDPAPTTVGTVLIGAHNLGAKPHRLTFQLVCTDAGGDAGYVQNDVILPDTVMASVLGLEHPLYGIRADATNVSLVVSPSSGGTIYTPDAVTGVVLTVFDPSKWKVEAVAELIS